MSTIVNGTAVQDSKPKTHALVSYILLTLGLFTAIPMLFGAIWAMFTRSAAAGTVYHSHYTNAIRTFWWGLFWAIIGAILIFAFVGFIILGITWLWVLYRLVDGFSKILADEPYPV